VLGSGARFFCLDSRNLTPTCAVIDEREIELKKIAVQLTAAMLDNHNGDWDDTETAAAFRVIYDAIKNA